MAFGEDEISSYMARAQRLLLATIDGDGEAASPAIRAIGGFANDGTTIYFSTDESSAKVRQIAGNANVAAYFQHEGQDVASFKSVTVIGEAQRVSADSELEEAIAILADKNPRFRQRLEEGELDGLAVFKIIPKVVKTLDFGRGFGPEAVEANLVL